MLLIPFLADDLPKRPVHTAQAIVEPPTKVAVVEADGLVVQLHVAVVAVVERPGHALLVLEVGPDVVIHEPLERLLLFGSLVDRLLGQLA